MCHNSETQTTQIDRFVDAGMPQKLVKPLKYTTKKRIQKQKAKDLAAEEQSSRVVALLEQTDEIVPTSLLSAELSSSNKNCNYSDSSRLPEQIASSCVAMAKNTESQIIVKEKENIAKTEVSLTQGNIPKGCRRFQSLARSMNKDQSQDQAAEQDALAMGTQYTKRIMFRLSDYLVQLQQHKLYTLLTKTTQPTHIAAIGIFSFVILAIWPQLIGTSRMATSASHQLQHADDDMNRLGNNHKKHHSTLATIAYLCAFAMHFGAQIWMTFVSGLALYFSLPRHTFGQCQQILFPKYFAMNAVLSISMLIIFMKYFLSWDLPASLQISTLALTALMEVTVRLYLAPPMLRLMHEKYKIESTVGSGQEVGVIVQGDLAQCPHYQHIHKTFRRIHMTIAIFNIAILLCSCLHLYFLASKIQIN